MRRAVIPTLLACVGVLALAPVAAGVSPQTPMRGALGVRLISQGSTSPNPLARAFVVARMAPGARLRRVFELANTTHRTMNVAIYAAAAANRGAFSFGAGRTQNDLSRWTKTGYGRLRLPPGSRRLCSITVSVPPRASSGERYAVIWAQLTAPAPAGGGVRIVNRVGIRMYVSVGPGGAPAPAFSIGPLSARRAASGAPLIAASIHNWGRGTLGFSGSLALTAGPAGLGTGPIRVSLTRGIPPGVTRRVRFRLSRALPRGPWRVHLRLTSGSVQHTAAATVTFPL
jgi:hypothetical protein